MSQLKVIGPEKSEIYDFLNFSRIHVILNKIVFRNYFIKSRDSSPICSTKDCNYNPFFINMRYYIYILYSEKFDKYYYGQTNDLKERLIKHNSKKVNSTAKYSPWIIFAYKELKS